MKSAMKRTREAEDDVMGRLESAPCSKKSLLKQLLSNERPKFTEKRIKKALRRLKKKGSIERNAERIYKITAATSAKSDKEEPREGSSSRTTALCQEGTPLPAAELLRRRAASSANKPEADFNYCFKTKTVKTVDLDEEIRRLEAELANEESHDDTSTAEEESSVKNDEEELIQKSVSFGDNTVVENESRQREHDPAILCLSRVAGDRIESLPASCLPQNQRRHIKGIDSDAHVTAPKKKIKVGSGDGLEEAVKEVLNGYVARSSEKLPYYCRVCSKQYSSTQEFFQHKQTNFHKLAVEMERKASFCKLCRKQFTSPVQLKEHVSSKPHKQRLEYVQSRQPHTGKGHYDGAQSTARSRRQWG